MAADRDFASLFARQQGLITREQVLSHGTARVIERRLGCGRWERVHSGVYRLTGTPQTFEQQVLAACLTSKGMASYHSAAALWRLPVQRKIVEITVAHARRISVPGVLVHRAVELDRTRPRRIAGIPVTSPGRTIRDLASVLTAADLEIVLDHAFAERIISITALSQVLLHSTRGRRGAGQLARLLLDRPTGVMTAESRFEMRLFKALRIHGLPEPLAQYRVRLGNGHFARIDFAFPEVRLAIEADSYRHHSSRTDWSRDRVRNNQLVALGWRVLPVTYQELATDPHAVAHQVAQCLEVPRGKLRSGR